jgi:hypothetical protein
LSRTRRGLPPARLPPAPRFDAAKPLRDGRAADAELASDERGLHARRHQRGVLFGAARRLREGEVWTCVSSTRGLKRLNQDGSLERDQVCPAIPAPKRSIQPF